MNKKTIKAKVEKLRKEYEELGGVWSTNKGNEEMRILGELQKLREEINNPEDVNFTEEQLDFLKYFLIVDEEGKNIIKNKDKYYVVAVEKKLTGLMVVKAKNEKKAFELVKEDQCDANRFNTDINWDESQIKPLSIVDVTDSEDKAESYK